MAKMVSTWRGLISAMLMVMTVSSVQAESLPQARWVGDVPIMPALTIEQGLGFAFDSPEGRIVMIYLTGDAAADDVMAYYDSALNPLGWTMQSASSWAREGESLAITRTTAGSVELWKLMIRPQ
ncbi:MAG: hypothetical protein J4F41_01570 [Alphaproteobacteria bacterium]|nr:hypothetical protein [Alphaproteobacteria bacterium]